MWLETVAVDHRLAKSPRSVISSEDGHRTLSLVPPHLRPSRTFTASNCRAEPMRWNVQYAYTDRRAQRAPIPHPWHLRSVARSFGSSGGQKSAQRAAAMRSGRLVRAGRPVGALYRVPGRRCIRAVGHCNTLLARSGERSRSRSRTDIALLHFRIALPHASVAIRALSSEVNKEPHGTISAMSESPRGAPYLGFLTYGPTHRRRAILIDLSEDGGGVLWWGAGDEGGVAITTISILEI